jgi:DNA-binding transcriptional regulator YdaS (Cro superfamily)
MAVQCLFETFKNCFASKPIVSYYGAQLKPLRWLAALIVGRDGMGQAGLDHAIEAAGGIGALARALGLSHPAIANWQKIPAERVLSIEAITGVRRSVLRPDLYPMDESPMTAAGAIDDVDLLRSHEYNLLALLLGRAPTREVLDRLSQLQGDASPLGMAHIALAEAADAADRLVEP